MVRRKKVRKFRLHFLKLPNNRRFPTKNILHSNILPEFSYTGKNLQLKKSTLERIYNGNNLPWKKYTMEEIYSNTMLHRNYSTLKSPTQKKYFYSKDNVPGFSMSWMDWQLFFDWVPVFGLAGLILVSCSSGRPVQKLGPCQRKRVANPFSSC